MLTQNENILWSIPKTLQSYATGHSDVFNPSWNMFNTSGLDYTSLTAILVIGGCPCYIILKSGIPVFPLIIIKSWIFRSNTVFWLAESENLEALYF